MNIFERDDFKSEMAYRDAYEESLQKGEEKFIVKVMKKLYKANYSVEFIANIVSMPISEVKRILNSNEEEQITNNCQKSNTIEKIDTDLKMIDPNGTDAERFLAAKMKYLANKLIDKRDEELIVTLFENNVGLFTISELVGQYKPLEIVKYLFYEYGLETHPAIAYNFRNNVYAKNFHKKRKKAR